MDGKAIETLSIEAVKSSIVLSDFLSPYINDNDREPSWDGNIYIYREKGRKKEDLVGRVPVQVKGKESNDLTQSEISYSLEMADLNNFLNDGGVMIFVVYMTNSGLSQIYYCPLLPVKLKILIHNAEGQKNKTVKLERFPTNNNQKREIFVNFFDNYTKQASFVKTQLLSIEELLDSGKLKEIKTYVTAVGGKDPQTALMDNEVYLYAETIGSAIPQPIGIFPLGVTTSKTRKASVKVHGVEWYSEYTVVKSKNRNYLLIGKSLTIDIFPEGIPTEGIYTETMSNKVTYKAADMLRVLVKDLGFMLEYMEQGEFCINDMNFSFEKENAVFSNFNIEEQKERLIYLRKVEQVFDLLGYKGDINLKKLSKEHDRNISILVTALIDKKPVHGLKSNLPPLGRINVSDAVFELYLQPDELDPESYQVYDFFNIELPIVYENNAGEKVPISQYSLLSVNDLCELTNLKADVLLPSFKKYASDEDAFCVANDFLLKLLEAYDLSNGKRSELIEAALQFSNWVKETADSYDEKLIGTLNFLQTIKRVRTFNTSELEELWEMAEDETLDDKNKVAVYLLLDVQASAQHYFEKLNDDQQEELKNYPIFNFWEGD